MTDADAERTLSLIARLEAATGWDAQIDYDIAISIGWKQEFGGATGATPRGMRSPDGMYHYTAPPVTASLDAALTLAAGFYWVASEGKTRDKEPLGGAQIFERLYLVKPIAEAEHERVEIALCIAALKARLTQHQQSEGGNG